MPVAKSSRRSRPGNRARCGNSENFAQPLERRMLLAAIASGQTITASIGAAGETDTYTINGVAGGSILATVGETTAGSALTPRIELHAPGGALLTANQNVSGTTITVNNTLPANGTYTLIVKDFNGTHTGGYAITGASFGTGIAQQAGNDGGPTSSALTKTASIGVGDIDIFTIGGLAGGSMLATVGENTAGSPLTPQIAIYSADGKLQTFNQNVSGTTLTINNTLPANGTYFVMVRDFNGLATSVGSYSLTVVSLGTGISQNAGGDAGPTTSALTKSAAIGVGDIDVFRINGIAGGSMLATIGETTAGSPLTPQIAIYSPAGQLLTFNQNVSGTTITINNTLPATGTYFVMVRDFNGLGTSVGNYSTTVVSLGTGISQNSGGDGGPTTSALTKSAKISVGDVDIFTISALAGDSFQATIGETTAGSPLTPQIALYSPDGKLLTFNQNVTGTTITVNNTLPAIGTYFVMVRDFNGLATSVGNYAMTAVMVGTGLSQDSGGDGGFLPSGSLRSAAISTGDIDVHPFYAVVGDNLSMAMTESTLGSALTPQMALYSPAGKLLTFNQNANTVTLNVTSAASSGVYFLVIRDFNGLNTGGYRVNLTETPSSIKPTITLAATDNLAVEGGFDKGFFTITRTNIRALPVTVGYSIAGTAHNGTDYTTLSGTAVIQPNTGSVSVTISALADSLHENSETVVLTLKSGSSYTLGTAKTATVTIDDGATISGTVFNDLNGNGVRNSGEPGLSGWKVFIDLDNDGVLDSNERSATTSSSGSYSFAGLAPGTYHVRVVKQSAFSQTLPAGGGSQTVTLALGATKSGLLFGEKKIA